MKIKGILQRGLVCLGACLLFAGMAVYADETGSEPESRTTMEASGVTNTMVVDETSGKTETLAKPSNGVLCSLYDVEVENWKRRIYKIKCKVDSEDSQNGDIRIYSGRNFHITDSKGNILSEGTYIDADGNVIETFKGGEVCRDINGWFILWENTDLREWSRHNIYVQADSDFVGGNNQTIGLDGMSGVYLDSDSGMADISFETHSFKVNVAAEVDASDVIFPVMKGIDLSHPDFLNKAVVKLECVYGNLRDLPLKVRWYRVVNGMEEPVGDMITRAPYHLPESEVRTLTEAKEYKLKIYYNGEASTEEARQASNGHEVPVSEDAPMDEASFKIEMVSGCIDAAVCLEQLPYNNSVAHTFRFKLYRFDEPNQMINDDTPFTEYSLTFDANGDRAEKHLKIDGLAAGWYTLVPENPEEDFAEMTDKRKDNSVPNARTGSSAGVDFHIGEIVDNQYSWEIIRYQGQNPENPLGVNPFKIIYNYQESLYSVSYAMNLPGGSGLVGNPPYDLNRYRPGTMVSVQGGNGMTADGWKFVGWALDAGDGVYKAGEKIYSDVSIHGIPVETQVAMTDGGLTLYGRWIRVYSVTYDGNTSSGGSLPADIGGTVKEGSNLYYSGDEVTVEAQGNLEKVDSDGTRYVFDGWSVNQDGSGTRLKTGDKVKVSDADITFYAQWRAVGTDKYAVNYIASVPKDTILTGVLPQDTEKYEEGAIVKVKDQGSMAIEHYRFAGWALTSSEDALYKNGEELFGTKDIQTVTKTDTPMKEQGLSFYSRWIPLYQVTYHANANKVANLPEDTNEYEVGDMVTILGGNKVKREGYEFIGWNTKMDGNGQSYDAGLKFNMPEENIELYAQWKKLPEPESAPEETETSSRPGMGSVWPMVILAVVGVICIIAYVAYQWLSHRKH